MTPETDKLARRLAPEDHSAIDAAPAAHDLKPADDFGSGDPYSGRRPPDTIRARLEYLVRQRDVANAQLAADVAVYEALRARGSQALRAGDIPLKWKGPEGLAKALALKRAHVEHWLGVVALLDREQRRVAATKAEHAPQGE